MNKIITIATAAVAAIVGTSEAAVLVDIDRSTSQCYIAEATPSRIAVECDDSTEIVIKSEGGKPKRMYTRNRNIDLFEAITFSSNGNGYAKHIIRAGKCRLSYTPAAGTRDNGRCADVSVVIDNRIVVDDGKLYDGFGNEER